jgi:hypothetical protein
MADKTNFECLSLSKQDYAEEITGEVTKSLMSMMRVKYEFAPGAMEIFKVLQELSNSKSSKEEVSTNNLRNENESEKSIALIFKVGVF